MTQHGWQRIAFGVASALVLGAGLFFGGRWQERVHGATERTARIAEVDAARGEAAHAQAELARAEDRIRLLRARSLLFETAGDLDRRNFGVANQHLRTAAAELEAVREGGAEMDLQGLRALQREVEATNLNVATDLEVQRGQVLQFLARLDELMPRERHTPAQPEHAQPDAIDPTDGGT
jgi:hypothetical protein